MENQYIALFSSAKNISQIVERFEAYVSNLGYENISHEILSVSYITNRGKLYVKGEFTGPSPYNKETRNVEDVSKYSYFVLEDLEYENTFTIEVKHFSAIIAIFKIMSDGIYLIDGVLPAVKEV